MKKKPWAYYNEHDKSAAEWLRQLIKEGVITDGTVDERSIEDVVPAELAEFDRCHFFAGVAVWDYALTRAGWPDDRRVWTGSCPCQPFSAAGKGDGFADERHLWPAWFHLIEQCRPGVIFGEQVSSKDTLPWIDLVHADLEGALYTVAAADLCSPSVGAPHIRQRLYFVADASNGRRESVARIIGGSVGARVESSESVAESCNNDAISHELAKPVSVGRRGRRDGDSPGDGGEIQIEGRGGIGQLGDSGGSGFEGSEQRTSCDGNWNRTDAHGSISESGGAFDIALGNAKNGRLSREQTARSRRSGIAHASSISGLHLPEGMRLREPGHESGLSEQPLSDSQFQSVPGAGMSDSLPGPTNGFWRDAEWIYCRDGKWRPVGTIESGAFEMADELAADLGCVRNQSSGRYTISPLIEKGKGRVMRLRGYGNAIVAEVAIAFIESYLELER